MQRLKSGIEIFISYVSMEKDLSFLKELHTHLKPLQSQMIIDIWHDQNIIAGMDLKREISLHLENAAIFLLLTSPDFIASDYHTSVEVKQALARHKKGEAHVIPILLRPVISLGTDLGRLEALPKNSRPIASWSNHDEAFVDVVKGVKRAIEKLMPRLQARRISLFGYEVQDIELYSNPQGFSLDESYKVSYLNEEVAYPTWLEEKKALTEREILNTTWIKVGDHGYSYIIDFKDLGEVVEHPLLDESTSWQGRWKLLDSGILRVNIDKYELDIYANHQGRTHSGIEFQDNLPQPHAYFVLLPLVEAEKSNYLDTLLLAFEQLLRINPICVEVHKGKGDTLRRLKRYNEALVAYEKTVELSPKHKWAWYDMGDVLRKLGHLDEAVEAYKQSIKVNPEFMWAWYDMGEVLCVLKRYEEALAAFEQARQLKSDFADIFISKGDIFYILLRYKEALNAYEQALRLGYDLSTSWRYTIVVGLSNLGLINLTPQEHGDTPDGKGHYWHYPEKSVHWSPEPSIHATEGEIRSTWANQNWEQGSLGYPVAEQKPTADGKGLYQHFQHGAIFWSEETGMHVVDGPIYEKWAKLKWQQGLLGYPITDTDDLPRKNGRHCHFQHGCIYWSPETGAHEVHGTIREKWEHLGWEQSFLEFPVSDEKGSPDGIGHISNFQHGSIYWHPDIGVHAVHENMYEKWESVGWERGSLGYPIADDQELPDSIGRLSTFQHGFIYWNPRTGASILRGEIGERWVKLRQRPGLLKYPISDQQPTADEKGYYQRFQRGSIFWSEETGAREVYGAIWDRWEKLKLEQGVLGYPTTGEMGSADGKGRYNHFQHGSIYYHPDVDSSAHEVTGAIHKKWASLGWEQSFLGYPVTGEGDAPSGRIGYFERGAIYWSEAKGTIVLKGSGKELRKRFKDLQAFAFALEQANKRRSESLSLVVYHIDHPGEKNVGYYRIGRNVDANGVAAGGWSKEIRVPFLKAKEHQGAGIALADLDESGSPALFIFRIDHEDDKNRGYYRIGKNMQAYETETAKWANSVRVPDPFGKQNLGAGFAVADLNKSGYLDLLVFSVVCTEEKQAGFYRIGRDLDKDGLVTGDWGETIQVPGDFGDGQNCIGIALADLDGNGQLDLLVFYLKRLEDGDYGYYRIGKHLDSEGLVTGEWEEPIQIPGPLGKQIQVASIAVADLKRNGRVDLVVFYLEHFNERQTNQNSGFYRIGRNLDTNGRVTGGWSDPLEAPGWFGSWNEGLGIAFTKLL